MIYLGVAGDAFVTDLTNQNAVDCCTSPNFHSSRNQATRLTTGFKISEDLCVHTAVEEVYKITA